MTKTKDSSHKQRPAIAIDLDDVLVQTARPALNFYNHTYGADITLSQYYSHDVRLVWKTADMDTVVRRLNAYLGTKDYQELHPTVGSTQVVKELGEKYDLHIVTGRPDFTEALTRTWVDKYFPDTFKSITFTNFFKYEGAKTSTKGEVCQRLGVTCLIDDHVQHAQSAAFKNIQVLLFGDYPWNRVKRLPPGVVRVANWAAVKRKLL